MKKEIYNKIYPFTKEELRNSRNLWRRRLNTNKHNFTSPEWNEHEIERLIYFNPKSGTRYIRKVTRLNKTTKPTIIKVRYFQFDKNGDVKLDKDGNFKVKAQNYEYVGDIYSPALTPKFVELKLNTFDEFLLNNNLQATPDSLAAHLNGIISVAQLKRIVLGDETSHPVVIDVVCRQLLANVRAKIENGALDDEGQTRGVFRLKSSLHQSEKIEEEKLRIEEKVQDRAYALNEEKFAWQKQLVQEADKDQQLVINVGKEI